MRTACAVALCIAAPACGFSITPVTVNADADGVDALIDAPCAAAGPAWWDAAWTDRFLVDSGGAPIGYTISVDAAAAVARSLASSDDVRVVVHAAGAMEIDRVMQGSTVELRVPAAGMVWLYTGNAAAGAPPRDAANVYMFAESFASLAINSDGSPRFVPQPATEWRVVDDNGNRVYRVSAGSRRSAEISGITIADGEIRARIRPGGLGVNNHDAVVVRSNSLAALSMDGLFGQVLEDLDRARVAEYVNGASPFEHSALMRPIVRGTWYTLRLRFVGTSLELYVDGVLEATGANANPDGQLMGLFAHFGDADFDDVAIRPAINPEPIATLGAAEARCAP